MAEILTDMESAETFKAYESYLLGQPAKAGTVLRQGAFLYIWKEKFETNGTVLQTSYGTVVTTLDSESKTLFACREFLGGRVCLPVSPRRCRRKEYTFFRTDFGRPRKTFRNGNGKSISRCTR